MKIKMNLRIVILLTFLVQYLIPIGNMSLFAQEKLDYQLPPQEIVDLIDAPPTPSVKIHPKGKWMLFLELPNLPSIEHVARKEMRIGGIRIDPKTNGQSRSWYYNNIKLFSVDENKEFNLTGIPNDPMIENVNWSPDGNKIAFTITKSNGIELWMADLKLKTAVQLTKAIINDATWGNPYQWMPDSKHIIYKSIDIERGQAPPKKSDVPTGPVVRENKGKKAPVRTFQDLLTNAHDEQLFKYFVTTLEGNSKAFGAKGIISSFNPSPNGKYILVQTVKEPFSYLVPYYRFPRLVEIWDYKGELVKQLADLPVSDDIPQGFGSVKKGPRSFTWRSDVPAELYWVEAQDEGDANKESEFRDKLFSLNAPFDKQTKELVSLNLRYGGITWGNENIAIIREYWWKTRRAITSIFDPGNDQKEKSVLFDRSYEDKYNDPGNFETTTNESGNSVLLTPDQGKTLFLLGRGASPEGNRPFIDKFNVASKKSTRLWQSEAPNYEYPYQIIDPFKEIAITRRESVTEQPNFFIRKLKEDNLNQLTKFPHPYPNFKSINKTLLKYKRDDGILLTGNLYLPYTDKNRNKNLPVIMWAYPQEFKSADAASQVKDSPYRFDRIGWWSSLIWLTQGYAVLNGPSMPIIGEGDEEPNDTYVKQLVSSAKAAVDTLVKMGIADQDKFAVGGHSYGAFMTANLLAHSDLFAAGIARSGAYNRTLTPFGFQSEERTFWEAKDIYFNMSPFMHADKIKEPLLLIHGEADNNSGTFPLQSKRFYNALKGHGATVRLVMLPHESHGYRARESILHMLWETYEWLEEHVKKENQN